MCLEKKKTNQKPPEFELSDQLYNPLMHTANH